MSETRDHVIQIVASALTDVCGIVPGDRLVVGVSGGCDSVFLIGVLAELAAPLGLALTVAHLDHGLREASTEDAEFVRLLCCGMGVPCVMERVDVAAAAAHAGVSIEMAAREARRDLFARVVAHQNAVGVVVGHTADDQAETLLLNMCRGTGLSGMGGMRPRREVDGVLFLRPMLALRRSELEDFLRMRGQAWREDSSNVDRHFRRNRVRHEVVPALTRVNAGAVDHLVSLAVQLSHDAACLDGLADQLLENVREPDGGVRVDGVFAQAPLALRSRVLRAWCCEAGRGVLSEAMTARLLRTVGCMEGSSRLALGGGVVVECAYGVVRVVERLPELAPVRLPLPGRVSLPSLGVEVEATLGPGVNRQRYERIGAVPAAATVALRPGVELWVRGWRPGDRMRPFGGGGSRKVQDIFCDGKVPRACRGQIPMVVADDEIVWIPGYRIADGWEVAEQAEDSIQLRLIGKESPA